MSSLTPAEPVTSNGIASRVLTAAIPRDAVAPPAPGLFTDQAL